jgi:hypothetical protein
VALIVNCAAELNDWKAKVRSFNHQDRCDPACGAGLLAVTFFEVRYFAAIRPGKLRLQSSIKYDYVKRYCNTNLYVKIIKQRCELLNQDLGQHIFR